MSQTKRKRSLALKTILLFILLGLSIAGSSIWLTIQMFEERFTQSVYSQLLEIADLISKQIDLQNFKEFSQDMNQVSDQERENEKINPALADKYKDEAFKKVSAYCDEVFDSFNLDCIWIIDPVKAEDTNFEEGYDTPYYYYYTYYDEERNDLLEEEDQIEAEPDAAVTLDPGEINKAGDPSGLLAELLETGKPPEKALKYSDPFSKDLLTIIAMVPLVENGKTIGVVDVEKTTDLVSQATTSYLYQAVPITIALTALFILLFAWLNRRSIIKPIEKVTRAANSFVQNKTEISRELETIKTKDEIEVLAQSVLQMEHDIQDYVEDIKSITAERERVETELNIASNIQQSLLSKNFPQRKEFDLFASSVAAKEVGGDFYDFFLLDETHLAFVIADVSGKGVPAALFMVKAETLIKSETQSRQNEKEAFERTNQALAENNEEGLFVTCWMGVLDLESGLLRYVNAGHNPPFLLRENKTEMLKGRRGLILASFGKAKYRVNEIQLEPGDKLFLYTDGLSEPINKEGEMFGEERIEALLKETRDKNVKEVIEIMSEHLGEFTKGLEQFDDITMLMVDFKQTSQMAQKESQNFSEQAALPELGTEEKKD